MPYKEKQKKAEYMRERRHKRRELLLCGECGKPSTKYRCNDCEPRHIASVLKQLNTNPVYRYKHNMSQKRRNNENKEHLALLSLNRRKARIQENRCVRCNAPLIEGENKYCVACMAGRYQPICKGVLKYETAY